MKLVIENVIPSTDWTTQCEAVSRKTNQRCPHRATSRIPSTLAAHTVCDGNAFRVQGREAYLCTTHYRSFNLRAKRILSLKLIDGGYLSPYNETGYGSVISNCERIDFAHPDNVGLAPAWGPLECRGNVPEHLIIRYFPEKAKELGLL